MVFHRAFTPLAASLDRAVARRLFGRTAARVRALGHEARLEALGAITAAYEPAFVADFFGDGRADLALSPIGRRDGIVAADARWPSRVTTFHPDPDLGRRFAAVTQNHRAAARLFLQPDPGRPAAILVHGYRAGNPAVEERIWPVRWLLARGMSVALFVLPFHAVRRDPQGPLRFPSSDPRFTNEGFRQAIGDLRGLVRWLRERGATAVGAMGMSLGGYTTSLLATVEDLDFLVPVIPLACFADAARHSGRLVGSPEEQTIQHQWIERAHRIVSPFARPSRVDADAVIVLGGEGDRITPITHAERLAHHFGGDLVRFAGGHLLQIGRADGFRAVGRMLRRRGLSRREP